MRRPGHIRGPYRPRKAEHPLDGMRDEKACCSEYATGLHWEERTIRVGPTMLGPGGDFKRMCWVRHHSEACPYRYWRIPPGTTVTKVDENGNEYVFKTLMPDGGWKYSRKHPKLEKVADNVYEVMSSKKRSLPYKMDIYYKGKHYLGYYETIEEAREARDKQWALLKPRDT